MILIFQPFFLHPLNFQMTILSAQIKPLPRKTGIELSIEEFKFSAIFFISAGKLVGSRRNRQKGQINLSKWQTKDLQPPANGLKFTDNFASFANGPSSGLLCKTRVQFNHAFMLKCQFFARKHKTSKSLLTLHGPKYDNTQAFRSIIKLFKQATQAFRYIFLAFK